MLDFMALGTLGRMLTKESIHDIISIPVGTATASAANMAMSPYCRK